MLKYATALYDATDPARFEALQKAADDFADRLATVSAAAATAAAPGSGALASPALKPASRIVSAVFVDVIQIDYQSRLHEIAASMDGNVEKAVFLLISDSGSDFIPENTIGRPESDFFSLDARIKNPLALRRDVAYLQRSYDRWTRERVCLLRALRSDHRVSSERLYAEFLEANSSALNKRVALDALKQTDDLAKALVAIREAHKALLTGSSDFGPAVSRIRLYADRLSALKDVINTQ